MSDTSRLSGTFYAFSWLPEGATDPLYRVGFWPRGASPNLRTIVAKSSGFPVQYAKREAAERRAKLLNERAGLLERHANGNWCVTLSKLAN